MAKRISLKPDELARQCGFAAVAIGAEPNWPLPSAAPAASILNTCAQNLSTQLSAINAHESQLRAARQAIKPFIEEARDEMAKVDLMTDLLYGRESAKKISFGLTPKKFNTTPIGEPEQVVIRTTADGTNPASIWVDWESIEGAVYEVQWFTDADLKHRAGSATVTASEMEVQDLERGKQYHFRIRAVRGGHTGPWSDQATRMANI